MIKEEALRVFKRSFPGWIIVESHSAVVNRWVTKQGGRVHRTRVLFHLEQYQIAMQMELGFGHTFRGANEVANPFP